jgi:hypothetical protein
MRLTRKEDISLYLYIKDVTVSPQYYEITTGASLTSAGNNLWNIGYDTELGIHPFKRGDYSGLGRGLVYFDHVGACSLFGIEQSDLIRVYDGATVASGYRVNYLTGQIETSEDLTGYNVDYEWNYVSVIDAWPAEDVPALPIISIEMQEADKSPLQLGGGDIRNAFWNIEIFASNKGERDDLVDTIYDSLYQRRCTIYTFPSGLPLNMYGFFNASFDTSAHSEYKHLIFENIDKKLTGLPSWGFYSQELLNRYRAGITFDTIAYKL